MTSIHRWPCLAVAMLLSQALAACGGNGSGDTVAHQPDAASAAAVSAKPAAGKSDADIHFAP